MEELKLKKIEIRVKKIDFVDKEGNDAPFNVYKCYTEKGWFDLKFRKECQNLPTKSCILYVEQKNININFNGRFPVVWISEIHHSEEYSSNLNVDEYFK